MAEAGFDWRKNKKVTHRKDEVECVTDMCGGGIGVDLNRNFPYEWGKYKPEGECNENYPGEKAGSEPEVEAITNYVKNMFPPMKNIPPEERTGVAMDVHSFGGYVLYPWSHRVR